MKPIIHLKRAYDAPSPKDGYRILVDRLWPRGVKKEAAGIDDWAKELAPTTALRQWFGHDPEKWTAFQKKYMAELKANEAVTSFISKHKKQQVITLVYGAKDTEHTHAIVLQQFLKDEF